MAKITLRDTINATIEKKGEAKSHRGYLGLSQMGHPCDRYLYYVLHDAYRETIYPRTKRIWERGDWEEHRVINDLCSVGITVTHLQEEIKLKDGHVRGHVDGIITNFYPTPALLEIKTMANTYWTKVRKVGLKEANKAYWVQAQLYAHFLNLKYILYCCVNKDTEERFFFDLPVERITEYLSRIELIFLYKEPPMRIGGPDWYECKFCGMQDLCHHGATPNKVCASCKYSLHIENGLRCTKGKKGPCDEWESCVT